MNGHGGGRPGGSSIKVIARLPVLDAEREAPPEREPWPETLAVSPVGPAIVAAPPAEAVARPRGMPLRSEPARFPLRSIVTLALVAAITWTAAWWNDRQHWHAERAVEARLEQAALEQRPERLAREGNSAR